MICLAHEQIFRAFKYLQNLLGHKTGWKPVQRYDFFIVFFLCPRDCHSSSFFHRQHSPCDHHDSIMKSGTFPTFRGFMRAHLFQEIGCLEFYVRLSSESTKTPPSQPSQRRHLKKAYFSESSVQCWRVTLISFQWISIIVSLYFVSLSKS